MPKGTGQTVYESLRGAAVAMGLSPEILKAAKFAGCTAFRSNRIYSDELLAFLDDNPDIITGKAGEETETLESLKRHYLREQIRRKRIDADTATLDYQVRKGELIERKDLEFAIPACLKESLHILRTHLPTELYNTICEQVTKGFGKILKPATEGETAIEET
jgi:hypothetical protein